VLVGKRVVLRTVRPRDLDQLYGLMADVRAMGDFWPLNLESEITRRRRLEETGGLEENEGILLITDRRDRLLGQILFFRSASYQNAYELAGRIYRPEDWNHGYMSEAVSLVVAFLFETRPVERIQATALPGNVGSQQVLQKCGFQFEGIMRRAIFHRGRAQDLHLFAIVRGEHRPLAGLLADRQQEGNAEGGHGY
jgi:ribosomal-protein-alanine N-acetyltransferase